MSVAREGSDTGSAQGRHAVRDFDVFLSYNRHDRRTIEQIAIGLKQAGLQPWLDVWCSTPGGDWQTELAVGLDNSASCAVFIGVHDLGGWSRLEVAVALNRLTKDSDFRVFPVLLPGLDPFEPSRLPPFLSTRTWVDFRHGVDDSKAMPDLIRAVKGMPFGHVAAATPREDACPYRGLSAFEEEDAAFFFGRDGDVQRLLERLKASRMLAVLGPSGSGKSSLVRAGLIPSLRGGKLARSDAWKIRLMRPGAEPLSALAAQLLTLSAEKSMQATVDALADDQRTLHLGTAFALVDRPPESKVVFVIDQLEEAFTLCRNPASRACFFDNLCYAAAAPGGRTVVIVTLRADFYPRLVEHPALAQLAQANQVLVGPLAGESLRQVIEEPAHRVGLELEPGCAELILADVSGRPGVLPLLEHALLETWRRRRGHVLTVVGYRETGGVERAVAGRAEALYTTLSAEEQAITRNVLLRLTEPGQGTEDTRRRTPLTQLVEYEHGADAVREVVRRFVDARLLTTSGDDTADKAWVEVAHEALIHAWPRLRTWIDEDREGLRIQRAVTVAAEEWARLGRDDGALFRGVRLAEATEWRASRHPSLNDLEREFLDASAERHRAERASRRRRRELAFAALIVVLIGVAAAAVIARRAADRAVEERNIAQSIQLASAADEELAARPQASLRLALHAYAKHPTAQAKTALRQAAYDDRAIAGTHAHHGTAYTVAVSRDGSLIASGGVDGLRLWDRRHHRLARLQRHGETYAVAFSPNGQLLASAGDDGLIRLWKLAAPAIPRTLGRAPGAVLALAFGEDGTLATADVTGSVLLWSLQRGRPQRLGRVDAPARSLVFLPDGGLAVGGAHGEVKLWRSSAFRDAPLVLHAGREEVRGVAVSPDGRTLAVGSADGKLRLWTIGRRRPDHIVMSDRDGVLSVAFTRAGRVVTGDDAGTVRIWDDAGRAIATLAGPAGRTYAVAGGPTATQVVSTGEDGFVWIWQPPDIRVLDTGGEPIHNVAVSPRGDRIAAVGADGRIRLWDGRSDHAAIVGASHKALDGVAFDPRGDRLVAVGSDGAVRVVTLRTGTLMIPITLRAPLWLAVFGDDGRHVVVAADNTIRIVDLRSRTSTVALRHDGSVSGIDVTTNGRIVSVGQDKSVRVGSLAAPHRGRVVGRSGHELLSVAASPTQDRIVTTTIEGSVWLGTLRRPFGRLLRGHDGSIWQALYTPDGRGVVSAGNDGTLRVWDLTTGGALVLHNGAPVNTVAITRDGDRIISGDEGGVVRVWPCDVCDPIVNVVARARSRWLP